MKIGNGHQPSITTEESAAGKTTTEFEPLLDCRQAARRVHCHEKTLQRYARQRRLPAYRIHGRWYFRVSELDSWVRSHVNFDGHPCRVN
jgi:excisionase family DNA binding protein